MVHVSNDIFYFFEAMERKVRQCLASAQLRATTKEAVMHDDEVQFMWSTVAFNWGEKESSTLLELVAGHWITIRGFSHVEGLMERFKQQNKKTTQKSKGLRKTLIGTTMKDHDGTD